MLSGQIHEAPQSSVLSMPLLSGKCSLAQTSGTAHWHSESCDSPFWGFFWELREEHQEVARTWLDLLASQTVVHSWTRCLHSFQGWLCDEMYVRYLMSVRRQRCLGCKSLGGLLRCLREARVPGINPNIFHDGRNGIQSHHEAIISEIPFLMIKCIFLMLKKPSHFFRYIRNAYHEQCFHNVSLLEAEKERSVSTIRSQQSPPFLGLSERGAPRAEPSPSTPTAEASCLSKRSEKQWLKAWFVMQKTTQKLAFTLVRNR